MLIEPIPMSRFHTGLFRRLLLVVLLLLPLGCGVKDPSNPEPFLLIAHAGGVANSQTYSNSLEALEDSVARGFTHVELDLSWTLDGHLVLLHDWDREFKRLFGREPGRLLFAEFRSAETNLGLTHLALEDLAVWMDQNPAISVITDLKERNIEGLRLIVEAYPHLRSRILPQIFYPEEYRQARRLGFEDIIYTLYVSNPSDDSVVEFAFSNRLLAVTMPVHRAGRGGLVSRLSEIGVRVLVHTVNDRSTAVALAAIGVDGVYTDWLSPEAYSTSSSAPR